MHAYSDLTQTVQVLLGFRQKHTDTNTTVYFVCLPCDRLLLLFLTFDSSFQATFVPFYVEHFVNDSKWSAFLHILFVVLPCAVFLPLFLNHQATAIMHFSMPNCLLLHARPSQSESVCIPVSWLDLRTLPFVVASVHCLRVCVRAHTCVCWW